MVVIFNKRGGAKSVEINLPEVKVDVNEEGKWAAGQFHGCCGARSSGVPPVRVGWRGEGERGWVRHSVLVTSLPIQ